MKKVNVFDYFDNEEHRQTGNVIAIYQNVSAQDWANLPTLAQGFFEMFEASISFLPIKGQRNHEVWILLYGEGVGFKEAEDFITQYLDTESN